MNPLLFDVCWIGGGSLSAAGLWKAYHAGWFEISLKKPQPSVRISPEWLQANRDEIVHLAIKGQSHRTPRAAAMRIGNGK